MTLFTPAKFDYAFVDTDAIIYPLGFVAASKGLSWEEVRGVFHTKLASLRNIGEFGTFFFYTLKTADGNYRDQFRNHVAYKAKRKEAKVKPAYIEDMLAELRGDYRSKACLSHVGEADDYICSASSKTYKDGYKCLIIHTDKDLNQIPGWHADINGGNIRHIPEIAACRFKYTQILAGDRADDIPGLRGYGPARANKVLLHAKNEYEMYERSFREYVKVLGKDFSDEEIAEYYYETANLVHLRRNLVDDQWDIPEKLD